jgi:hypothetical protein
MNGRFNFRCPSFCCRVLIVGLVYAVPGVLAGAVLSVWADHPLACLSLGGLAGLGAGMWLESDAGGASNK